MPLFEPPSCHGPRLRLTTHSSSSFDDRRKTSEDTLLSHTQFSPSPVDTDPGLEDGRVEIEPESGPDDGCRGDAVVGWDALDHDIGALPRFKLNSSRPSSEEPAESLPRLSAEEYQPMIGTGTDEQTPPPLAKVKGPFHKWMRTLHRRATNRPPAVSVQAAGLPWQFLDQNDRLTAVPRRIGHRKSSSGSSYGFVAAVRSASISFGSASAGTRSRRNPTRSHPCSRTNRSVRSGPRHSEDSGLGERAPVMDSAATARSLQRRRILEELINTEEGYISDVRFLMNVYVTILASLPCLPMGLRSSINRNLTEIVELHEGILGELHRAVPYSEYRQVEAQESAGRSKAGHGHHRWRSLDAVPENKADGDEWLNRVPGLIADPQMAGDVARIFGKKMNRLFIYKEYGAKYEMMVKDVAATPRTIRDWATYQKGLEALAASLGSANTYTDQSKKALTLADLLVKPIQRVCRYPLLFSELLKHTPVSDCPNSHMEVESVLIRLREATAEINRATNDVQMKETLEKTWLLQDRLVFPNQRLDAASKARVRSFGHIQLCGALHICWQTRDGVSGQYLISLLYRDVLCLASAGKVDPIYTIQACVCLAGARVEETDNGRGLQCHTAPFSWKLVFECDHQLYEIIMTSCSPKEEIEWRTRLGRPAAKDQPEQANPGAYSSLALNMKSLGAVLGKPETAAGKTSIQRATTIGSKGSLSQVMLKNTCVLRDAAGSSSNSSRSVMSRSQSLLTAPNRVTHLSPPRAERARLEALLSDVWSREVLPFPGMTSRARSEHLVRTSASSMMRKLSVAAIASSFTKRSAAPASVAKAAVQDEAGPAASANPAAEPKKAKQQQRLPQPPTGKAMHCDVELGGAKARLPMIEDEMEGKGTPSAGAPSIQLSEHVDEKESAHSADSPLPVPVTRAARLKKRRSHLALSFRSSSSINLKLSRQSSRSSLRKSSVAPADSEQQGIAWSKTEPSKTLGKSDSRWARVGSLKGLFR